MPRPRRSNLSRQSRNARRIRNTANERTEEEQEIAREQRRDSMARLRASQSREQSEAARETARLAMQNRRANNRGQQIDNLRRRTRYLSSADLNRAAFQYETRSPEDTFASPPLIKRGKQKKGERRKLVHRLNDEGKKLSIHAFTGGHMCFTASAKKGEAEERGKEKACSPPE